MLILALLLGQPEFDRPLRSEGRVRLFELPPALPRHRLLSARLSLSKDVELEDALERALARLAAARRPDGLWSDDLNDTSFALLAFAAAGYETSIEPYARTVRGGLTALLARQAEWGIDVRRMALATSALAAITARRTPWTSLTVPLARAQDALLDRRGPDGTWGDSAVTLWARLAWHDPHVYPRPPLTSDAAEHQAFKAFHVDGDRAWRDWLEKARPRLLQEVEGVEATARQAIEIATPYRFRTFPQRPFGPRGLN